MVQPTFDVSLRLPDLWQQEAVRALQRGEDVIVDAPTGSGKTYIFELLVKSGLLRGQAVYTVPTRALANDKMLEWRQAGWNVGICTGDVSHNLSAPVVVATLETQKRRLLAGDGPALLVVDEYQMLGDHARGVNYEVALALAPASTRLLLLSGSVANPESVAEWLRGCGRHVQLVRTRHRPVPLQEVNLDALPDEGLPENLRSGWPRLIGRALQAGLGPILVFAPRRQAAEDLAKALAAQLPPEQPLTLSGEQARLADDDLARLLRARIGLHHSGLGYRQRAGLIEPLAKMGQLRVVVATTGLAAGVNFSLRSVLLTDRDYRHGPQQRLLRADELLQMFGRAGRRGLDDLGHILYVSGKPRLPEARPLQLPRENPLDWPAFLSVLAQEGGHGAEGILREFAARLFTEHRTRLGLDSEPAPAPSVSRKVVVLPAPSPARPAQPAPKIVEILAGNGCWERRKGPVPAPASKLLRHRQGAWLPALSCPDFLEGIPVGVICLLQTKPEKVYGRDFHAATLEETSGPARSELLVSKPLRHMLRGHHERTGRAPFWNRPTCSLEFLERKVGPMMAEMTGGGVIHDIVLRDRQVRIRLSYASALFSSDKDSAGNFLHSPPERTVEVEGPVGFRELLDGPAAPLPGEALTTVSTVAAWRQLGLVDASLSPTRRGLLVSFFQHGEGLAIAAALEDERYPVEEVIEDLANLRSGPRFSAFEDNHSRLGLACRAAYGHATHSGYLLKGVPPAYGPGAAEILFDKRRRTDAAYRRRLVSEHIGPGDIERLRLEWRSLLQQIALAPDLPWERWRELQALASRHVSQDGTVAQGLDNLPPLTAAQRVPFVPSHGKNDQWQTA